MRLIKISVLKLRALLGGAAVIVTVALASLCCFVAMNGALELKSGTTVRVACVDLDGTAVSSEAAESLRSLSGVEIISADEETAETLLRDGKIEGIITLFPGFESALLDDDFEGVLRYTASGASSSGLFVKELVAGQLLAFRAELAAKDSASGMLGRELTEAELARLEALTREYREKSEPLYTVNGSLRENFAGDAVFSAVLARYYGFAAFAVLLVTMTLGGTLSREEYRAVDERLKTMPSGGILGAVSDIIALCIPGILIFAEAVIVRGISPLGFLSFLSYILCCSCLSRLVSLKASVPGRIGLAAPAVAFVTSLVGGCFANIGSLSPALRTLSFLTPQGIMLYGVDKGSLVAVPVLLALSVVFFLLSRKKKVA